MRGLADGEEDALFAGAYGVDDAVARRIRDVLAVDAQNSVAWKCTSHFNHFFFQLFLISYDRIEI